MKLLSVVLICLSLVCFGWATTQVVGGFDWNQHFVSTMLRGEAGTAQNLARLGVLMFALGIALIFVRLPRLQMFEKGRTVLQVGGIGAAVYATFSITVLHDLVVTISMLFYLAAHIVLLRGLHKAGEKVFLTLGWICLAVQLFFATSYYTGFANSFLPWGQRISFGFIAAWLTLLDWKLPSRQPALDRP